MKNTALHLAALSMLLCGITIATSPDAGAKSKKTRSIYHEGWIDFNKNGVKDVFEDPSRSIDERVEDLLGQMNVEEKTCQLTTLYGYCRVLADSLPTERWKSCIWKDGIANIDEQLNGVGKGYFQAPELIYPFSNHVKALNTIQRWFIEETRLGSPVEFTNEGIHGLNHTKATQLPAPIGIGSTWDRAIVHRAGEIAGEEALLLGYQSVYAPILDLARDPRWGRTVESYGEDPYLVSELGIQMVNGIQRHGVTSCLKHYAAYSVPEGGRDAKCRTAPHIGPRELHEVYMYPFAKVIGATHPMEIMSSYNDWDGLPVSGSHYFLTELLRDTYGFDGYVVSDSQAVEFVFSKHEVAADRVEGAKEVIEAGLNVRTNFEQPETFIEPLREAIARGIVSMEAVDQRVREVLSVKFRLGLFDNPFPGDAARVDAVAGMDKHQDFAHDICARSMVLLKNEGGLLPLDKNKIKKILVTGPLADGQRYMTSRYGPNGLEPISVLRGLREYLDGEVELVYRKGCDIVDPKWPESEIIPYPMSEAEKASQQAAVDAASDVDVIIAVMGEDEKRVGESLSRTSLDLPGRQRDLLMALHATGKPVVLVLVNGQPLTINWENAFLPAILETWFPNVTGGRVVAETLFGDNNPGGHLSITFPKTMGQIPYNFPFKKGAHGVQNSSGPDGHGTTRVLGALYPFGYGLSYTTFSYDGLKVDSDGRGNVTVSCSVTNTGSRRGDEVVQLYLRDRQSSVVTFDSILRGFERITLEPGETQTVSFRVEPKDLQILDRDMKWAVEPGEFEVRVGSNSEDIRLRGSFKVD